MAKYNTSSSDTATVAELRAENAMLRARCAAWQKSWSEVEKNLAQTLYILTKANAERRTPNNAKGVTDEIHIAVSQSTDKEINALIQAANKRLRDTCSHLEWRYCKEDGEYEIGIANDLEGTYEAYCIGYGADEIPDLIPDAEKWARTDHAPEEVQVMRKTKRQKLLQMVMELTNQQAAEVIAFIKENIKC